MVRARPPRRFGSLGPRGVPACIPRFFALPIGRERTRNRGLCPQPPRPHGSARRAACWERHVRSVATPQQQRRGTAGRPARPWRPQRLKPAWQVLHSPCAQLQRPWRAVFLSALPSSASGPGRRAVHRPLPCWARPSSQLRSRAQGHFAVVGAAEGEAGVHVPCSRSPPPAPPHVATRAGAGLDACAAGRNAAAAAAGGAARAAAARAAGELLAPPVLLAMGPRPAQLDRRASTQRNLRPPTAAACGSGPPGPRPWQHLHLNPARGQAAILSALPSSASGAARPSRRVESLAAPSAALARCGGTWRS